MARNNTRGRETTQSPRTDISSNIGTGSAPGRANYNTRGTAKIASGLNILAGLWLALSPWILGYTAMTAIFWNATVVGILVLCLAAVRFVKPLQFSVLSWINLVLGVWLIISAFVLPHGVGSATGASSLFWHDIIVGAIILVLSLLSADSTNNTVR